MNCPNSHGPMMPGRKFWICEECGYRTELSALLGSPKVSSAELVPLERLPSPVAIPWHEYSVEENPVLRLDRLFDATEISVRLLAVVALGEARRSLRDGPLPDDLLSRIQKDIERPTFGRWWRVLSIISEWLPSPLALLIPEVPAFVRGTLAPLLNGKNPQSSLIELRNERAHGGGLSRAAAARMLDVWKPRVDSLLAGLAFLSDTDLRFTSGHQSYSLTGHAPILPAGAGAAGHVSLHRGDEALDLWPLADYGPVLTDTNAAHPAPMPSGPRLFYRAERDRLLFRALGVEPWQGESRDALASFRALFRLDQWTSQAVPDAPPDFEQEIHADADALVGRRDDLTHAKTIINEATSGILWISGPGGMGKTFLMARLAADYGNDPRKICRLVWRFRAGDVARCSRLAFLRYAVKRLSQWKPLQTQDDPPPTTDPAVLHRQLAELLARSAVLPAPDLRAKPPRVLFFLDGIDEIERIEPGFAQLPFNLTGENVVWICAGRPEGALPDVFAESRCAHVFPNDLLPMNDNDVRTMLLEETGPFKYALLAQDSAEADAEGRITNPTVEAVVLRAQGLPLYVRYVIADVVSGHFQFKNLAGKLPPSLIGYYDDLLRRLSIGDLQALLTPLVSTLAWALAPLNEEALHLLMVRRNSLWEGKTDRTTLHRGLQALHSMIRAAPSADGGHGYELNHLMFREHVRHAEALSNANAITQDQLCKLTVRWEELPSEHPVRCYALQFGPQHLHEARRWDDLYALACSEAFLHGQYVGLREDPDAPLRTLRLAMQGAIAQEDALKLSEFAFKIAQFLPQVLKLDALGVLRHGNITRALKLADLHSPESALLYRLLFCWELYTSGNNQDADSLLAQLLQNPLTTLSSSTSSQASWIFAMLPNETSAEWLLLAERLLDVFALEELCGLMSENGRWFQAERVAQMIIDPIVKIRSLSKIGEEAANAGELDFSQQIATILEGYAGQKVILAIARRLSQQGDDARLSEIIQQNAHSIFGISILTAIGEERAKCGDISAARQFFADAWQLGLSLAQNNNSLLLNILHVVNHARVEARLFADAISDLHAFEWLVPIQGYGSEFTDQISFVGLLARAGDFDGANQFVFKLSVSPPYWVVGTDRSPVDAPPYNPSLANSEVSSEWQGALLRIVSGAAAEQGQWDTAEQIALSIKDRYNRSRAFATVTVALARTGKSDKANFLLTSIDASRGSLAAYQWTDIQRDLVETYIALGDLETALRIAVSLAEWTLVANISQNYARHQKWDSALKAILLIPDFWRQRFTATKTLMQIMKQHGNGQGSRSAYQASFLLGNPFPDRKQLCDSLIRSGHFFARHGHKGLAAQAFSRAIRYADCGDRFCLLSSDLKEIALSQYRAGLNVSSNLTLYRLLQSSRDQSQGSDAEIVVGRLRPLQALAEVYMMFGREDIAAETITSALEKLPEVGRHDDVDRARELLVKIALSRDDFSTAMRLTGAIQGSCIQVRCLCLIAAQQHKAQNDEAASQMFSAAYLAARNADYPSQFDWTELVQGLTRAKRWDEAVGIIWQIDTGNEESTKCERVKMLGIVGYSLALNRYLQKADGIFDEASKLASTITIDHRFTEALSHLLRWQGRGGRFEAARQTLSVLLEQETQSHLFYAAQAQAQLGLIEEALQNMRKIAGGIQRSAVSASIAKQLAGANRGADAVQVAGQINADKLYHLPEIAAVLAAHRDRINFLKLLPICRDTTESATRMTCLLMLLYPEQADNIGEHIINVLLTDTGLDLPTLPEEEIFMAATEGQFVDVKEMLARNPSLATSRDPDGWTALHLAARQGQKQAVQILLQHGADINAVQENREDTDTEDEQRQKEKDGRTPLHSSVYSGNVAVVRLLLEHGAQRNLTDHYGRRAQDVTEDPAIKQLFSEDGREKPIDE